MSDDDVLQQNGTPDGPSQRRRWWRLVPWLITGFLLLRMVWLFLPGDGRGGIEIGPETTVISEPLAPDGFVDFSAAINARAGKGVTPENNAVVLLIQAFGPAEIPAEQRERYFELLGIPSIPEAGQYFVNDSQFLQAQGVAGPQQGEQKTQWRDDLEIAVKRPWTDAEFPQLAEFLIANEAPLALIVEATQRTRYYSPIAPEDAELIATWLNLEQQSRWGARLLSLRAMRRLGAEDAEGAWTDILACHRLARLVGQSPHTIGVLVSYALDRVACAAGQALVRSEALTSAQARQCIADLDALPPIASSAAAADFGERLSTVDTYCRIASGRSGALETDTPKGLASQLGRAFDWNLMLKLMNEHLDRSIEIMRLPTAGERMREFAKLDQELRARKLLTWQGLVTGIIGLKGTISRDVNNVLMRLLGGPLEQYRNGEMLAESSLELTRIGFALTAYHREHGAYPQTLAELAPGILAESTLDPCSGKEFVYRTTARGFVLYSVGTNLTDDGGTGHEDRPRGDDVVLRVGVEQPGTNDSAE